MGGKLGTEMNIMPFRDGRTENVGTFVFDHPTCGKRFWGLHLETRQDQNEF